MKLTQHAKAGIRTDKFVNAHMVQTKKNSSAERKHLIKVDKTQKSLARIGTLFFSRPCTQGSEENVSPSNHNAFLAHGG